ncbi:MAG: hypothetical protein PG977_000620 [Bartonella clarridgeiae]|nr:MAG: hypothetical protein PG977_000620 [Bartonella clarridgeiae]
MLENFENVLITQEDSEQVVKMPSQAVRNIFKFSEGNRINSLNTNFSLYKEIKAFV